MKKIFKYIAILLPVLSTGCSDYFDINKDPNQPTDVSIASLMPTVQLYGTKSLAQHEGMSQLLSAYTHQVSTREPANKYSVDGNDYTVNTAWRFFYKDCMQNLSVILKKAEAEKDNANLGIAKILKAYYYSQWVDIFGDVPFSEATSFSGGISQAKFDKDSEIYTELFNLLDQGIALLDESDKTERSYDLIYKGNQLKWIKAANTIKLKLYNQIRLTKDVSAEVNALLASGKLISSADESFVFKFGTNKSPDERNPAFLEYEATQKTNCISPWFFEIMKGINPLFSKVEDPRIPYYFYNQIKADAPTSVVNEYRVGGFVSIYFGSDGPRVALSKDKDYTMYGVYLCGGRFDDGSGEPVTGSSAPGDAPYRYLTYADRLFIEAELISAGVIAGNAGAKLQDAISESFAMVDYVVANSESSKKGIPVLAGTDAATNYSTEIMALYNAADKAKQMEIIMTQKWIQNYGNGVDQYTDYRRTGYPVMFDPKNPAMAPGGKVTPPLGGDPAETLPAVPVSCSKSYPVSLPWANDDLSVNSNAPAQKNDPSKAFVFWDK